VETRRASGFFAIGFLAVVLAACQPRKPASAPTSTTHRQQTKESNPKPAGDASFKDDAMAAMAALSSRWMLLGTNSSVKEAPRAWHRHAASGTCMPKDSASWELGKEQVYGPDDESVTLWNDKLKTEVTLYTYPATQPLDAEFGEVMRAMGGTCSEGPMMSTTQGDVHFGGCVRRLDGDVLLLEQVVLFQRGKWLHKARITLLARALGDAYDAAMGVVSQAFAPCSSAASGTANTRPAQPWAPTASG
jgi:hypothetical protein